MKFWMIYSLCSFVVLLAVSVLAGKVSDEAKIASLVVLAIVVLAPLMAPFLDAVFTFADPAADTVSFSGPVFWTYLIRSLIFSYGLFVLLVFTAHFGFKMIEPAGEGAMVLLFNVLAPPFVVLGSALLFYLAHKFEVKTEYFRGWYIPLWFVVSPVIALFAWMLLLPVYNMLMNTFSSVTEPLLQMLVKLVSHFRH